MISNKDCMKLILNRFPNFKQIWNEHIEWWGGDVPGLCNDMSAFTDYVVELLKVNNEKDELHNIFIFIEELVVQGDETVSTAATTCFLENLINSVSWKTVSADSFIYLLGPESKKYCKAWDEFTGVKTPGLWPDNK